jgi:hypothetical protein
VKVEFIGCEQAIKILSRKFKSDFFLEARSYVLGKVFVNNYRLSRTSARSKEQRQSLAHEFCNSSCDDMAKMVLKELTHDGLVLPEILVIEAYA